MLIGKFLSVVVFKVANVQLQNLKKSWKQNLVHLRLSFRSKRLIFKNDYSWSFIDFMLVCFILEDFAIIRFCVRTISSGFDLISQMKIWLVVHQWWRHHLQKILALLKKRAFWSVLSLVSVSSNGGEESGSEQLRSQTTELWKKLHETKKCCEHYFFGNCEAPQEPQNDGSNLNFRCNVAANS